MMWVLLMLSFSIILLHICDASKSGVDNDGRFNFYNDVHMLSALYQISNKIRATYGHKLPLPTVENFVKFDGVIIEMQSIDVSDTQSIGVGRMVLVVMLE